jgi:hypothetical protein
MSYALQARVGVCLMLDGNQEALHACMLCGKRFPAYDEVQQHYRIDH